MFYFNHETRFAGRKGKAIFTDLHEFLGRWFAVLVE